MPTRTSSTIALAAFAFALAAAFIAIPAWQLIGPGPFDWHVRQPAFVQGGIEALVLIAFVASAFALRSSRAALLLAAAALAFYLRRHAVDIPVMIDLLYVEIIIGVGMLVRRLCGAREADDTSAYVQAFLLGFIAWSLVAWTASAFDVGSIRQLRVATLALGLAALCARTPPLIVFLWRRLRAHDRVTQLWGGALAGWIAVLYARTNVVYGYDSLWYGLRGEYVLDPGHSAFDALGLVSPVHYFPKLYEVFLLPVSAFGDSSVISGVSIWGLVLILLTCARIAGAIGIDPRARADARGDRDAASACGHRARTQAGCGLHLVRADRRGRCACVRADTQEGGLVLGHRRRGTGLHGETHRDPVHGRTRAWQPLAGDASAPPCAPAG